MPNKNNNNKHRHFILHGTGEIKEYRSPQQGGIRLNLPHRNRVQHAGNLRRQLQEVQDEADTARRTQQNAGMEDDLGIQVEFESFPGIELAFEKLARERSGIELLNVHYDHENKPIRATVFVPDGKLNHFENLIRDCLAEKTDSLGRSRDNRLLIDTIQKIRAASIRELWTDTDETFPTVPENPFWWEAWLPIRGNQEATAAAFRERADTHDIQVAQGCLMFPERTVLLVRASLAQMQSAMPILNDLAEIRRAKETAAFFDAKPTSEQRALLDFLLKRIKYPSEGADVPFVCVLDTGVNRGHPLLTPTLTADQLFTVNPAWGVNDTDGHGTQMAGLALTGNLTELLVSNNTVEVNHRLESVKLLPRSGATGTDPRHHGYLTTEAVVRPEISAPLRHRVFGMAVTAQDNRDRGKPSAWSAAIDALTSDSAESGSNPRLLIVSAGNVDDLNAWCHYPASNDSDGIHDPAQAWNALTVGAYTDLIQIDDADARKYKPIAPAGSLSPFSTTSIIWEPYWPLKPDVVFEGGNAAKDSFGAVSMSSLNLLTTHHQPTDRPFTTTNATSAATALASRFAAQIMAVYPDLWPETIRALTVHSAEWPPAMKRTFKPTDGTWSKHDYLKLVRRCGFGVPNLERALWSVAHSLTMVVEDYLQPFKQGTSSQPTFCDMRLHQLPWPIDVLEELGGTEVEMRVTLSYFIEPNPSQRGHYSKYRYASHGLRFDVRRSSETTDAFLGRINAAARDEEDGTFHSGSDLWWMLGKQRRHKGSLHADIWRGTAAGLANRGLIAVYPAAGWWKTRPTLLQFNRVARYALVVSIRAPEVNVDLHSAVANQVAAEVQVES